MKHTILSLGRWIACQSHSLVGIYLICDLFGEPGLLLHSEGIARLLNYPVLSMDHGAVGFLEPARDIWTLFFLCMQHSATDKTLISTMATFLCDCQSDFPRHMYTYQDIHIVSLKFRIFIISCQCVITLGWLIGGIKLWHKCAFGYLANACLFIHPLLIAWWRAPQRSWASWILRWWYHAKFTMF